MIKVGVMSSREVLVLKTQVNGVEKIIKRVWATNSNGQTGLAYEVSSNVYLSRVNPPSTFHYASNSFPSLLTHVQLPFGTYSATVPVHVRYATLNQRMFIRVLGGQYMDVFALYQQSGVVDQIFLGTQNTLLMYVPIQSNGKWLTSLAFRSGNTGQVSALRFIIMEQQDLDEFNANTAQYVFTENLYA